jgi:hypothetical protein
VKNSDAPLVRYRAWVATAREMGVPEEKIREVVAEFDHVDRKISRGECPECGAPVRRIRTGRQGGVHPPGMVGAWVMYRCSRDPEPGTYCADPPCGFMLDRFESKEAN